MGVDNFWVTKDRKYYCPGRPVKIWGGGIFGVGPDPVTKTVKSFRGKVYFWPLLQITGLDLEKDWGPKEIGETAQKLLRFVLSGKYWNYGDPDITPRHWRDLTCMFLWYSSRISWLYAW